MAKRDLVKAAETEQWLAERRYMRNTDNAVRVMSKNSNDAFNAVVKRYDTHTGPDGCATSRPGRNYEMFAQKIKADLGIHQKADRDNDMTTTQLIAVMTIENSLAVEMTRWMDQELNKDDIKVKYKDLIERLAGPLKGSITAEYENMRAAA